MKPELVEKIRGLAGDKVDPKKVDQVIKDWDRYFGVYMISSESQEHEFDETIKMRLSMGIVSIAAPNLLEDIQNV